MEQSMTLDNDSDLNSINTNLTTPCRFQKHLFIPSSSSSKRSLFREEKRMKEDGNISDTESDLGPMSPLALTDQSSCDSSPGRQFVSPLTTPEKLPKNSLFDWNYLKLNSTKNSYSELILPSSSLKRVIKSAQFSQKSICEFLPKSKLSQFSLNYDSQAKNNIKSTDSIDSSIIPNEVISITPVKEFDFDDTRSYVAETPQKKKYLEHRLITPLSSGCKTIPIPKIHKRKPLGSFESNGTISPEIKKCVLKRHLVDLLPVSNVKYKKIDESSFIPKARASLFQDNKITNEKEKKFTLNPKSFYGSTAKSFKFTGLTWKESQINLKKRRNLSYSSTQRRAVRKHKKGEINCGVGHGIKRPKRKHQSLISVLKTEKQNDSKNKIQESKENLNPQIEVAKNNDNEIILSKEVDHSKKFFKCNLNQKAVVTVNDKIKLKVIFNQTDTKHINKKTRLDKYLFDATDLSVDETHIEPLLEQNKVVNILKILENDWTDDECDTMETAEALALKINTLSPNKSNIMFKDLTMSPASELSNMASTMNIEDISVYSKNHTNHIAKNIEVEPIQKFYPLFSKHYLSNITKDENNSNKRKRATNWQLSTKYSNVENQYQIDAGQKVFGATQCNECEIIYHIGDPDDENAHLNYHNSFKSLKFPGWKNERIIYENSYNLSRIILIEPKDSNLYWKKVTEVLKIVDRDLGLSDMKLSFYRDKKVYMYISNKTVLGILVAEYIKDAFQMIPELIELNCCTSETTPVKCGINVVWTAMSHRRQGIATKLVDVLRTNYYYGYIMSITDIAFSTPTPSGKQFAEKYTKTRNFKVY